MQIYLSPIRADQKITYHFSGETITATYNNLTEIYGLSFIEEGQNIRPIEYDDDGKQTIHIPTNFPFHPIISAKRKNGVLYVELVNFIGKNASQEERFSEWKEVN